MVVKPEVVKPEVLKPEVVKPEVLRGFMKQVSCSILMYSCAVLI